MVISHYGSPMLVLNAIIFLRELLRRELPYANEARNYSPLSWNFDKEPFDTT